ncbi:hypothetical protein KM043_015472 [Ampulex compressa]|nr:hypothetical protein KM043_015472 [Ampulex compressa]
MYGKPFGKNVLADANITKGGTPGDADALTGLTSLRYTTPYLGGLALRSTIGTLPGYHLIVTDAPPGLGGAFSFSVCCLPLPYNSALYPRDTPGFMPHAKHPMVRKGERYE